jgi:hypothetical protein
MLRTGDKPLPLEPSCTVCDAALGDSSAPSSRAFGDAKISRFTCRRTLAHLCVTEYGAGWNGLSGAVVLNEPRGFALTDATEEACTNSASRWPLKSSHNHSVLTHALSISCGMVLSPELQLRRQLLDQAGNDRLTQLYKQLVIDAEQGNRRR